MFSFSFFFKIGVIIAAFQSAGTMPRRMDKFNKDLMASDISIFIFLRILGYVLSGPELLFVFRTLIAFKTSSVFISKFGNIWSKLLNGTLPVSLLFPE